jgi:hypothetical protein
VLDETKPLVRRYHYRNVRQYLSLDAPTLPDMYAKKGILACSASVNSPRAVNHLWIYVQTFGLSR